MDFQNVKLDGAIMIAIVLCIWLIISNKYIRKKEQELSMQYKQYFGREVDVYIPYFTWEIPLLKRYLLRKKSFVHEIEQKIYEKKA